MDFFKYKDYINYHGEDYFSLLHIFAMLLLTALLVFLIIKFRNIKKENLNKLLVVVSIVMPILEVIKITWESYYDIKLGHGFNYSGLLPLYTCSMFMYVLPFAVFSKNEKVKRVSMSWLCSIGVFGGLTNFYLSQILHSYPLFTFATFHSLFYHFMMSVVGLLLLTSKSYKLEKKDILISWIPIVLFSIIVIPVNYYLSEVKGLWYVDYMLLMHGYGAPLLPNLSQVLIDNNLQFLFTIIALSVYLIISALVIGVYRLVIILSKLNKRIKNN